jgi:hypothetical protein
MQEGTYDLLASDVFTGRLPTCWTAVMYELRNADSWCSLPQIKGVRSDAGGEAKSPSTVLLSAAVASNTTGIHAGILIMYVSPSLRGRTTFWLAMFSRGVCLLVGRSHLDWKTLLRSIVQVSSHDSILNLDVPC